MSTDISIYAEKRVAASWQLAEEPELHIETVFGIETGNQWYEPQTLYFDSARRLEDVLVRDEWDPPSPLRSFGAPRGLPPDLSPLLRAQAEREMDFSRDHSWLSLAEFMAFDWYGVNVPVYGQTKSEYVTLFDSNKGFPAGVPKEAWWLEAIEQPDEARRWIKPGWAPVSWLESTAELVGRDFLDAVLPPLRSFGAPEDVRVVFWFS
jgi:hypothetical protein